MKVRRLMTAPERTAKTKYPVQMANQVAPFKLKGSPKRKAQSQASSTCRCPNFISRVFSDRNGQWAIFERQSMTSEYRPVKANSPLQAPRMVVHATHSDPNVVTFCLSPCPLVLQVILNSLSGWKHCFLKAIIMYVPACGRMSSHCLILKVALLGDGVSHSITENVSYGKGSQR